MADGTRDPRPAHDRDRGPDRGRRAPLTRPPLGCATETQALLADLDRAIAVASLTAGCVGLALALVLAGALVERALIKRRLQVVDGEAAGAEPA